MKRAFVIAAVIGSLTLLLSCSSLTREATVTLARDSAGLSPTAPLAPTYAPTPPSPLHLGWAYEAYPEATYAQMVSEMRGLSEGGADSVWIGHNNPGDVDSAKVEPGLSFAVWYALTFESGARQSQARAMSDAIRRALDAARAVGLKVVLPIGYQIMMGSTWNDRHPGSLRRNYNGSLLQIYGSPPTASPYDPTYRSDTLAYYQWVEKEWVAPYRDIVLALSLSDEPLGGDYSDAADSEFQRRYGMPMRSVPAGEEWKLGEFEAGVVVDFAKWSAEQWQALDPGILTTISFHSQDARTQPGLPEVERLFSETPGNFAVTFDTYLHDDLPGKPASADQASELRLFLTTLGHYSRTYQKPLLLWAGVNAWGLAEDSASPLDEGDAAANLFMIRDLSAEMGGDLRGIYAWSYNVKQQGLYNYAGPSRYSPATMQAAVEAAFGLLRVRSIPSPGGPDAAVLLSPGDLYAAIGRDRPAEVPPPWFDAASLASALENRAAVLVTPGPSLQAARGAALWICLAHADSLDDRATGALQTALDHGAVVMAFEDVASRLQSQRVNWPAGLKQLPTLGSITYVITTQEQGLK